MRVCVERKTRSGGSFDKHTFINISLHVILATIDPEAVRNGVALSKCRIFTSIHNTIKGACL